MGYTMHPNRHNEFCLQNSGGLQEPYVVSNIVCAVRNCTVSLVNPEVYMGKEGMVYSAKETGKPKKQKKGFSFDDFIADVRQLENERDGQ